MDEGLCTEVVADNSSESTGTKADKAVFDLLKLARNSALNHGFLTETGEFLGLYE